MEILRGRWFGLLLLSILHGNLAYGEERPLPLFEPGTWNWVDIPETYCRDGSPSGFMVNYNAKSKNLMIFLEGGGACFNAQTCSRNPKSAIKTPPSPKGIFDQSRPDNPVAGWNIVYIPYCTGDIFAGSNEQGFVSHRIRNQKFVGYRNISKFMKRITPTFMEAEKVLLAGASAGGFGAAWNYDQIQKSFGDTPVYLLDDSGITFTDDYLPKCLQRKWRDIWNINTTIPEECSECRQDDGGGLAGIAMFLERKYGDRAFAYLSSTADNVIRLFYGFGKNNCTAFLSKMSIKHFKAGLNQMMEEVLVNNSVFFVTRGYDHTSLATDAFYKKNVDGTYLHEWVRDVLNHNAGNKGNP